MRVAVILAAAGKSSRFSTGGQPKKVFAPLLGKPVWRYAAETFRSLETVAQIILVISPEDRSIWESEHASELKRLDIQLVDGGAQRADSVANGLAVLNQDITLVAVHDAARPLVTAEEVQAVFVKAHESGAAILATPVTSTVKHAVSGKIDATIPRADLWLAQTPQVFRKQLLLDAYRQENVSLATDDAMLVEQLGHPVEIVPGNSQNIKITTSSDVTLAEHYLRES